VAQLQIAVVGAGLIGKCHMALLHNHPETQLCALIDPNPAAITIAQQEGVPYCDSLDTYLQQLIPSTRPDAIILATPNALHVSGALACIAAGIPVLIEKPVADTLYEAEQLVDAVHQTGVIALVGHHRRHSNLIRSAKEIIDQGSLGRLVTITGSALFYKPDSYFAAGPWRTQTGGGPVLINMIHEIDSLRYLMGDIVQVQAMTSNAIRGFAVEDSAAILLRFASGALATFVLSDTAAAPRSWEQTSGENPVYALYPQEDCYFISGTRGSLAIPTLRTWHYQEEGSWHTPFETAQLQTSMHDPMAQQLNHFCEVLHGRATPLVTVDDATNSLRVTMAVLEAAANATTVHL
jgi:predicted dehydrogenase